MGGRRKTGKEDCYWEVRRGDQESSFNGKEREEEKEEVQEGAGGGFFACYLLSSLSPRHKGHTYIGFTVNPRRRIRQHNGEIGCGAFRTKRKRPWEMVMCIYGFPTNVSALQFEWAWQHPTESIAVRSAAASFKSLSGVGNKIKLALTMLTLSKWQDLDLKVNFFSSTYTKHSAGCPSLPEQMKVQVSSMDELPCYIGTYSTHQDKVEDNFYATDTIYEMGIEETSVKTIDSDTNNDKNIEETTTFRDDYWAKENRVELDWSISKEASMGKKFHNSESAVESSIDYREVEVIDLLSPSPICRVGLKSKRRRVSSKIIDLTESPIFV